MDTKIKIIIDSNPNYKRYLRTNSYWYKILNRNPEAFKDFVQDMKEKYKLTPSDRINNILNSISMLETFLDVLK